MPRLLRKYSNAKKIHYLKGSNTKIDFELYPIWQLNNFDFQAQSKNLKVAKFPIFGNELDLSKIDWHRDNISGFTYPKTRFDKLKAYRWFNQGIDIKYPWEVSRFHFSVDLTLAYLTSKNEKHISKYKGLVIDWIDKNPFLYGVNWYCSIEVGIRAANWIYTYSLLEDYLKNDSEFMAKFLPSLIQHAEYIFAFPEIERDGHTNNHAVAGYLGLLFLAVTLNDHPKSQLWLNRSISELSKCIKYQTYPDGINFEGSIPYHRFVTELFAYGALICLANKIHLPEFYYKMLFKMFEYVAMYIDKNGNAPQIGDNDSGRLIIINNHMVSNHLYLLKIAEHIFDYKFHYQGQKYLRKNGKSDPLPLPSFLINPEDYGCKLRETSNSIKFGHGGAYVLKDREILLFISLFPLGQSGRGGHSHYDLGSFTLSYDGIQIAVDPGTGSYTRFLKTRNHFRSRQLHNVPIIDNKTTFSTDTNWRISPKIKFKVNHFSSKAMEFNIWDGLDSKTITRSFSLSPRTIKIVDHFSGDFSSQFHLPPEIEIIDSNENFIFFEKWHLQIASGSYYTIEDFDYSPEYDVITPSKKIIIKGKKQISFSFIFNN